MENLIRYESGKPTIMGRELHELLNVEKPYRRWIADMRDFKEGKDYRQEYAEFGHRLSLGMAKAICQDREEKEYAKYLSEIEEGWQNTPEIMREELAAAYRKIDSLSVDNAILRQRLAEIHPKHTYYDVVLESEEPVPTEEIAEDYGMSAEELEAILVEKGILQHRFGVCVPAPAYDRQGYAIYYTSGSCWGSDDQYDRSVNVEWLQKGRLLIYDSLKVSGILPEVEK